MLPFINRCIHTCIHPHPWMCTDTLSARRCTEWWCKMGIVKFLAVCQKSVAVSGLVEKLPLLAFPWPRIRSSRWYSSPRRPGGPAGGASWAPLDFTWDLEKSFYCSDRTPFCLWHKEGVVMRWGGSIKALFCLFVLNSENYYPSEMKALIKILFEIDFLFSISLALQFALSNTPPSKSLLCARHCS